MIIRIDNQGRAKDFIQNVLSSYMLFSDNFKLTKKFLNNILEQYTMQKRNVVLFL